MRLEQFERRVEILKLLHGKKIRTGEIAEHFGVDDRTIRTDLDSLREGMDILGTTIKLESKHEGSQKHYYKSTVHPIMMSLNLSELLALLKLLESKSKEIDGVVYETIFHKIYSQMTDYAESIISPRLERKYDKIEIINTLEEEAFKKHRDYKLIFWNKSGRFIEINYLDKDSKLVTKEVKLVDIKGNEIKIEDKDGRQQWIDYGDIAVDWSGIDYK